MTARQSDRRADLARIHCLKRDLRLPDDEYRDLLFTLARVRSAADLDHRGREMVILHLVSLTRRYEDRKNGNDWIARAAADHQPLLRKALALAGDRGKRYADGIAKKMFAIELLEFCSCDHLRRIVAALEYDRKRRAAKGAQ